VARDIYEIYYCAMQVDESRKICVSMSFGEAYILYILLCYASWMKVGIFVWLYPLTRNMYEIYYCALQVDESRNICASISSGEEYIWDILLCYAIESGMKVGIFVWVCPVARGIYEIYYCAMQVDESRKICVSISFGEEYILYILLCYASWMKVGIFVWL